MTTVEAAPWISLDWSSFRDTKPRTVSEVMTEAATRPSWLLDGLIHPSATLLTGPPKSGKSFLVVEWTEALASGRGWHGRDVPGDPRPVLILPTDPGGREEYALRYGHGEWPNIALANPPRPGDGAAWQRLAEDAAWNGVGLVVLDNLYSYNPVARISDNGEVGVALAGLSELGRRGIPYLVIHHPPKNQTGYAGATSIEAHFRHLLYMSKTGRLAISGNYAVAQTLQLVRGPDGRVARITDAELAAERLDGKQGTGTRSEARAEARERRIQQAISLIGQMPPDISDREKARRLIGAIPGIRTEGQARTLFNNATKRIPVLGAESGGPASEVSGPEPTGG